MDVHTLDSGSEGESYTTAHVCWWPKKLFLETSNGWEKGLVSTQTQRPELRSQHTCKRLSVVVGSYDTGCVGNLGATAKSISSKFTESLSQKIRCRAKEGSMQHEALAFMCVHMHVCTYPYKQVDTHKICVYSTHSHIHMRETERWETETQREAENRDTHRDASMTNYAQCWILWSRQEKLTSAETCGTVRECRICMEFCWPDGIWGKR